MPTKGKVQYEHFCVGDTVEESIFKSKTEPKLLERQGSSDSTVESVQAVIDTPMLKVVPPVKQYWLPDKECLCCFECGARFNVLKRKHHCRLCGRIFCQQCSSESIDVRAFGYSTPQRACTHCAAVHKASLCETTNASTTLTIPEIATSPRINRKLSFDNESPSRKCPAKAQAWDSIFTEKQYLQLCDVFQAILGQVVPTSHGIDGQELVKIIWSLYSSLSKSHKPVSNYNFTRPFRSGYTPELMANGKQLLNLVDELSTQKISLYVFKLRLPVWGLGCCTSRNEKVNFQHFFLGFSHQTFRNKQTSIEYDSNKAEEAH
ncbi:hypothetical protein Ciccas_013397 [Cichlidogyrus casuarinus]|uniref:FYVE-type domain-containing protein n=1 Tax=Cichlidogyrus casuarinus TaxID=1844966 RepID=A0ABD2PKQ5_9PLAT